MKAYKRADFIKLPENTIYSRIDNKGGNLMDGLFCKITDGDYGNDFGEQDLISEPGFPEGIKNGSEAFDYQENLRDTFQEFRTDLECGGRDGMFDDSDVFVVWDLEDITKLRDYLNGIITIRCECGNLMSVTDADINNGTNEEGEEYGAVSIRCIICKKDYEDSRWGEWNNDQQAIEVLKEYVES